ncbi:response regulator [Candidatus Saccharibacteria bacterium]|nr:response regulator [Candidatus Saccharibacteria bacterium]
MILVLDDDAVIGKCLLRIIKKKNKTGQLFNNAIEAVKVLETEVPEMVFMDVFLTGPDGFTFLNELASYPDTMNIPIVIVSEKDFSSYDLSEYNVVATLNKNMMKPEDVAEIIDRCTDKK